MQIQNYTLPQEFIQDESVPLKWKLCAELNGFWISGKTAFASNEWLCERLGCPERTLSYALKELERLGLLRRMEVDGRRELLPARGDATPLLHPTQPHCDHTIKTESLTSGASAPQRYVVAKEEPELERLPKADRRVKDKEAVYNLFSRKREPWMHHAQQRLAALRLFDRGVEKVRKGLAVMREYEDDKFCPQASTPFEYEQKLPKLQNYLKRKKV